MTADIMVDSSVWIEYFWRKREAASDALDGLLEENRIVICDAIEGEILCGIRMNKGLCSPELQLVGNLFVKLPYLETEIRDHLTADERWQEMRGYGITIPVADCLIGAICLRHDLSRQAVKQERVPLSEILGYINEHFGTEFTDEDRISHFADDMQRRMTSTNELIRAFDRSVNPSKGHRRMAFEQYFGEILEDMIDSNFELYKKIVEDEILEERFKDFMFQRMERFSKSEG